MRSFPTATVVYLLAQARKALHDLDIHVMIVVSVLVA